MPSISVIIPTYTISKDLENKAISCAMSIVEADSEVIISEDGGFLSHALTNICDLYLYSQDNVGFTKNVNRGLRAASGDYLAIVNSDVEVWKGSLYDLCIPGKVTSPLTRNQDVPGLAGHFFVIPRTILEERGFLDERMKMFCSDADYERRVKDIFQQVPSVEIYHEVNATIKQAGMVDGDQLEKDREVYASIIQH